MNPGQIEHEIGRFDAAIPMERAATPPKSWYVEPAMFERERDHVFRRHWQYACPLDLVRKPGSHARVDFLGESWFIVRGSDDVLRAFHNVCRHHAAELVAGTGCADELVCPYHGWTYALDGSLKRAPQMGAMKEFAREAFGLLPLPIEVWGPLVFIHPGKPEWTLAEELAGLDRRLSDFGGMDQLRFVTRRSYPMQCNWKVFVDNYLDGGYHVPHLHHGLASQLDVETYKTECFGRHSIQTCGPSPSATFRGADFRERIGGGAIYAWLYPNFMLNRYGPILDINWVRPIAHDRCSVEFDYWFPETPGGDPEKAKQFIDASLLASDAVQREDVGISESVQRGLGSRAYDTGRYAQTEISMHQFHRLLSADLRSAPPKST